MIDLGAPVPGILISLFDTSLLRLQDRAYSQVNVLDEATRNRARALFRRVSSEIVRRAEINSEPGEYIHPTGNDFAS